MLKLVQEVTVLQETVTRLQQHAQASPASVSPHAPINTLSITDIVSNSLTQHGYESDASPATPHHSSGGGRRGAQAWSVHGGLEPLLLEAETVAVMTNPVFLDADLACVTVPATPITPAPRLLQAVASQQV